ncbi:unnamed protein product [Ilex paraguariensis]|uniref:Pentatricopeptide repeat-containing protein n=1 Tax=Ilex paraguariensis TaxID=185542 RepID=A0ABC8QW74_9AQUA
MKIRLAGVRPNEITCVGILSACTNAGMIDRALAYFEMMKKGYRIKPVIDHHSSLVDMFIGLGLLDVAFDFIKKMNFEINMFRSNPHCRLLELWNLRDRVVCR